MFAPRYSLCDSKLPLCWLPGPYNDWAPSPSYDSIASPHISASYSIRRHHQTDTPFSLRHHRLPKASLLSRHGVQPSSIRYSRTPRSNPPSPTNPRRHPSPTRLHCVAQRHHLLGQTTTSSFPPPSTRKLIHHKPSYHRYSPPHVAIQHLPPNPHHIRYKSNLHLVLANRTGGYYSSCEFLQTHLW